MNRRAGEAPFRQIVVLALVTLAIALSLLAKEKSAVKSIELPDDNPVAKLKPGPGVDAVEANCMGCHSTDYIVRQPGGDAQRWQDEVSKMIKLFGATISDEDAKIIVNYLANAYAPALAPRETPSTVRPANPASSTKKAVGTKP